MLQYIIKLTISLSIVYLFYQLFLRRLTFYNWNRWYLLIYSIACFVIPFVNVFTIIVNQPTLRESAFINYIPAITQITPANGKAVPINWMQVTVIVIITGMLLMIVRLLIQYYSLFRMRSKAVLLYDDKVKLYHIDAAVIPFSFGRGIYVNQHQHTEDELKEIIRHEFIHVKQRHSLDIMWSEILCILNWYNPFAWLLRHDIRQNLEFIADRQVLQTGLDRKQYQYLLLKVIGGNSFSIAANFNFSSLKKRIAMMNKAKSARVHLVRFLFMLPLLVVVLLAFRNTTQIHRQSLRRTITDTVPQNKLKSTRYPAWNEVRSFDMSRSDSRNGNQTRVILQLKNGATEKYDFAIAEQKKAFEEKYGALPQPQTPPPPPALHDGESPVAPTPPIPPTLAAPQYDRELPEAPEAPEKPEAKEAREKQEIPEVPEAPEAPEITEVQVPVPPAIVLQDCLNKKGYCITVADNYGECVVIIKDKNNKIVEAVSLTDWNKDKQYEAKYGDIPPRPVKVRISQKSKPVTLLNVKPVTILQVKPTTSVSIKVKPNPVKVITISPINKAETKPFSEVNASPVAAASVKIINAKSLARVNVTSTIRVTSAVSAKSAVPVKITVDPKATVKPVVADPEQRL